MNSIDAIFKKLDTDVPLKEIRKEIIALLADHLNKCRSSLGYWEKLHFLSAISALASNRNFSSEQTSAWLRLCLVNIENALIPKNQRNENYGRKDAQIEAITCEQLVDALNDLNKND